MTQHISESEMNSFRSGLLPAWETIPFAEHLEICRECSVRLATLRGRAIARFSPSSFLAGKHIEYEAISDYLDDRLEVNDREFIEIHLKLCHICHDDVQSLKEFRESSVPEGVIKHSIRDDLKGIFITIGRTRILNALPAEGTLLILTSLFLFVALLIVLDLRKRSMISSEKPVTTPLHQVNAPPVTTNTATPKGANEVKLSEVIYDKRRLYGLDNKGNSQGIDYLPKEIREDVANVLRGKQINRTLVLDELAETATYLRGHTIGKGDIWLISPVGTLIVEDRPLLKWKLLKGATSYLVDIVDESLNPIAQSGNLLSPEWLVDITLKRDAVYLWQVTAYRDKERIEFEQNRIGKFKVVSVDKLNQVEIARKKYTSHLALAVFYIKVGLLDDARSEMRKLISRNPNSKLLKRIYRREMF